MMKLATIFNLISAVTAFIAAFLWFWSTRIEVEQVEDPSNDGFMEASILIQKDDGKMINPYTTAIAQAKWNRWAAFAAGLAATFQSLGTFFGE